MTENAGAKSMSHGDGPRATEAETPKLTFTAEQQAKVQELIDDAYRKAYSKALKSRGNGEDAEALKLEVEKLKGERKMAALYRAISRFNVVDADEVAKLVSDSVVIGEDGEMRVRGQDGPVHTGGSGRAPGVDEYVAEWLSERPHHLRNGGISGAGSRSSKFAFNSPLRHSLTDPSAWRGMPREDLERLLEEGVNVHGSAGQVYSFKNVKNPFLEARKRRYRNSQAR